MAKVEIYTRDGCGYCERAKALLNRKGAAFTEYNATRDPAFRGQMIDRSKGTTFPQVFINDRHVGGCDDLHALDARGGLDPLLAAGG